MRIRARPTHGRSVTILAFLALALAAPATVLGAGGTSAKPILEPREMVPGEVSGYRLPFTPGLAIRVEQGWNSSYSHNGRSAYAYDFGLPLGTWVRAAAPGVVAYTHAGETQCGGEELRNNANIVTIDHPDGSATQYGHLGTVDVEVGDVVKAGDVIGTSGMTGYTGCRPHLHFARQVQGSPVTQSVPIYFQGFEDAAFVSGEIVQPAPGCAAALTDATAEDLATNVFCGAFFTGDFDGPKLFSRFAERLDVQRKKGGPRGYWLDGAEAYSVRWKGRFDFAPSWYTFRIEATGGVRVTLDGVVLIEARSDARTARVFEFRQRMRAGVHEIVVEHESMRTLDRLRVDWQPVRISR